MSRCRHYIMIFVVYDMFDGSEMMTCWLWGDIRWLGQISQTLLMTMTGPGRIHNDQATLITIYDFYFYRLMATAGRGIGSCDESWPPMWQSGQQHDCLLSATTSCKFDVFIRKTGDRKTAGRLSWQASCSLMAECCPAGRSAGLPWPQVCREHVQCHGNYSLRTNGSGQAMLMIWGTFSCHMWSLIQLCQGGLLHCLTRPAVHEVLMKLCSSSWHTCCSDMNLLELSVAGQSWHCACWPAERLWFCWPSALPLITATKATGPPCTDINCSQPVTLLISFDFPL